MWFMIKRIYLIKLVVFSIFLSNSFKVKAQSLERIIEKTIKSTNNLDRGYYQLRTMKKSFDFEDTICNLFNVSYKNYKKGIECMIYDSLNKKITFYDSTKFFFEYSYVDSTVKLRTKNNPSELFFEPTNPYFLQSYFSFKRNLSLIDSNENYFIIVDSTDYINDDEFVNVCGIFLINKKTYFPFYYSIYVEEIINDSAKQIQYFLSEILNQDFKVTQSKLDFQKIKNQLPISKLEFPEYDLREKNVDSLSGDFVNFQIFDPNLEINSYVHNYLKGPSVLIYTYKGCHPCKLAIPMMKRIQDSLGINVISINPIDTNLKKVKEFIFQNGIKYPYLLSLNNKLFDQFNSHFPTFVVIDKDKKIVKFHIGFSKENETKIFNELTGYLK